MAVQQLHMVGLGAGMISGWGNSCGGLLNKRCLCARERRVELAQKEGEMNAFLSR